MRFYTNKNTDGVTIDGIPDQPGDLSLDPASPLQWLMASGKWGTAVMILKMPDIQNSAMTIYYRDNRNGGTSDGTEDSGDRRSNGDMGLRVRALGDYLQANELSLTFYAYLINEPNMDAAFGDSLSSWETHPLEVIAEKQSYEPSLVQERARQPESFTIYPAFPNPYNRKTGPLQIKIDDSNREEVRDVTIYNVLGQPVAYFSEVMAMGDTNTIQWNGLDFNGEPVLPGVYFYQVRGEHHAVTQKLVILP
jgi:hypothetical protein